MTDIENFPEDYKFNLMHLGYLAQNWATLEIILDGIVRHTYVYYEGDRFEPSPPQAFKRKQKYIRKIFSEHKDLVCFSTRMNDLLETAGKLAEIRHWALHSGWAESDSATSILSRYNRSDFLKWETKKFSNHELYAAAIECAKISIIISTISNLAFNLITNQQFDELIHEFNNIKFENTKKY